MEDVMVFRYEWGREGCECDRCDCRTLLNSEAETARPVAPPRVRQKLRVLMMTARSALRQWAWEAISVG